MVAILDILTQSFCPPASSVSVSWNGHGEIRKLTESALSPIRRSARCRPRNRNAKSTGPNAISRSPRPPSCGSASTRRRQRRAELDRRRTTPGVGIPAAARRSRRDLPASRPDPHYRRRPRPPHDLGAWRSVPGGGAAPLARSISRRTGICATTRCSSHECCWALASCA